MKKRMLAKLLLCAVMVALTLSMNGCAMLGMLGSRGNDNNDDGHDWKTEWEFDGQYHWHRCNDCDESGPADPHDDSAWTKKARGHYKVCATCGAEYAFAPHAITDATNTCADCGYVASGTQELTYTLNGDAYTVTGLQEGATVENLVIPSHYQGKPVTKIAEQVFVNDDFASVTIGCNITEVERWAFGGKIETVYYTGTLEDWCGIRFRSRESNPIYNSTYKEQTLVIDGETITKIAPRVVTIEDFAFIGYAKLTDIDLQYVQELGGATFLSCSGLTSVTLPANLINPKSETFWYCTNLETVIIPDGVRAIGSKYFYDCRKLKTVTIGKDLHTIGAAAFGRCEALQSVTFANPDGWSRNSESVTGLNDPAVAAKLLREEDYSGSYDWVRK